MKTRKTNTGIKKNASSSPRKEEISISAFLKELTEKNGGKVEQSHLLTPETASVYKFRTRSDVGH